MTSSFIRACLLTAALSVSASGARAAFEFIPPVQPPASSIPAPAAAQPPIQSAAPSSMTMAPSHVAPAPLMPAPAPAASVVSEALSTAGARTSPQSILPPGAPPSLPQYTLAAPASAPAPSAPAAPPPASSGSTALAINMNPLGLAGAQKPAPVPSRVEQAMVQVPPPSFATKAARNASYGGMPMPQDQVSQPGQFAEAVGFGRDLPLALAVSQIVPPDYAFAFDQSVSPGEAISWEGGKPWDQVLNEALSQAGASARIDTTKKEISIVSGGTGGVVPAAYTPPASPTPVAPAPRAPAPAALTPVAAAAPVSPMPASLSAHDIAPVTAAPPVTIPSVLDTKAVNVWQAERGATLRKILEDWAMRAGVELFWSSDYDFPVSSSVRISGTFEEAVQTLLNGLRDAQPRPIGRLHPNLPDGPSVLIVETRHILQ